MQVTQEFEPRMLTTQQAAKRVGRSVWTIRLWLKKGLKSYRPGGSGQIFIRPEDLEAFVHQQAGKHERQD